MIAKPKILCVDDEPNILEGLGLHLRRHYEVLTAPGGAAALEIVARTPDLAVIMSDMRMPGMDGAAFLCRARQLAPDAVRLLLTGQAEFDAAVAAVNEGQIFRFLTKPCAPETLQAAVAAALAQHRLLTAERVLLEQTLHGTIQTLMDVLALANPLAFGRANRIKQLVTGLAARLQLCERWQLEVAAMLSQLAAITLPPELVEKLYHGRPLAEGELRLAARLPLVSERLLKHIPRLETVRALLGRLAGGLLPPGLAPEQAPQVERGVQLLRVAMDFDELESQGSAPAVALATLRGRSGRYAADVLEALAQLKGGGEPRAQVREVALAALREGMVLAEDVRTCAGVLVVPRGYEVTAGFIERVRNFRPGTVKDPLQVIVRAEPAGEA